MVVSSILFEKKTNSFFVFFSRLKFALHTSHPSYHHDTERVKNSKKLEARVPHVSTLIKKSEGAVNMFSLADIGAKVCSSVSLKLVKNVKVSMIVNVVHVFRQLYRIKEDLLLL